MQHRKQPGAGRPAAGGRCHSASEVAGRLGAVGNALTQLLQRAALGEDESGIGQPDWVNGAAEQTFIQTVQIGLRLGRTGQRGLHLRVCGALGQRLRPRHQRIRISVAPECLLVVAVDLGRELTDQRGKG